MIIVQDIHQVIGRSELDFENLYRKNIEPALQNDSTMRLPFFAWCPHGAGEGFEAVTITTLTDGEALDRYQERLRYGDLGELWAQSETMRYTLHSSIHQLHDTIPDWQEQLTPPTNTSPGTSLYRLDTLELSVPISVVTTKLNQLIHHNNNNTGVLTPLCWWSPLFGDADDRNITVLSRITSETALKATFHPTNAANPWTHSAEETLNETATKIHRRLLRTPSKNPQQPT
jgi:hypothetical protein